MTAIFAKIKISNIFKQFPQFIICPLYCPLMFDCNPDPSGDNQSTVLFWKLGSISNTIFIGCIPQIMLIAALSLYLCLTTIFDSISFQLYSVWFLLVNTWLHSRHISAPSQRLPQPNIFSVSPVFEVHHFLIFKWFWRFEWFRDSFDFRRYFVLYITIYWAYLVSIV